MAEEKPYSLYHGLDFNFYSELNIRVNLKKVKVISNLTIFTVILNFQKSIGPILISFDKHSKFKCG